MWTYTGHQKIKDYYTHCIQTNQLAHAYILYGNRHIGKEALVKNLISKLYCNSSDLEQAPCNACEHCRHLSQNMHPDYIEIDVLFDEKAKKKKKNISIKQIQEMQEKVNQSAFLGSYKVVVIKNGHLMSISASNSLLKSLEEPPEKTYFFILSENIEHIPLTIRSRSVHFEMRPVHTNDIKSMATELVPKKYAIDDIVQLGNRYPLLSHTFLYNNEYLEEYIEKVNNFIQILEAPLYKRFSYIESYASKKSKEAYTNEELIEFLEIGKSLVRDMILLHYNNSDQMQHRIKKSDLTRCSNLYSTKALLLFIKNIKKVQEMIYNNINSQLALENLFLGLQTKNQ